MFETELSKGKAAVASLSPVVAHVGTLTEIMGNFNDQDKYVIVAFEKTAFEKAGKARQYDAEGKLQLNPDTSKPYALGFNVAPFNIRNADGRPEFALKSGFLGIVPPILGKDRA